MLIAAVALMALPAVAQNMEWKSTSTMRGSGNYVAPVTAVGATSAASTYSPAKAPNGPRKIDTAPGQDGGYGDDGSTVGDVWPLVFFALAMTVVIGVKRKVNSKIEKQ